MQESQYKDLDKAKIACWTTEFVIAMTHSYFHSIADGRRS